MNQPVSIRLVVTLFLLFLPSVAEIIPVDRATVWNPGILVDTEQSLPLGGDRLPVRDVVVKTLAPGDNINAAIKSCPAGQVIELRAGTYTTASTISLKSGVVLRGAGAQGASNGGTTIVKTGGGTVIAIGESRDGACYDWGSYSEPACDLTADAAKGTVAVTVGDNASKFKPGDFALIDQVDDSTIVEGDCAYFKRVEDRGVSQRVEIASVDAANGTLTLASPLHWSFRAAAPYSAQVTRVTSAVIRWAGIESVRLQGGTAGSYNGESAGGIDMSNAGYCWVKSVQTDSTIGGIHIALRGCYRCVVRDCWCHHSADYGFGTDCYGIVIGCASSDNLIENNIARYMNKPLQLSNSGGGNVLGYNYADNAWSDQDGSFQEVPIDAHCAFPHMELVEGNCAPHMGLPDTHGAAGYITFFRNYASTQFAYPPVYGRTTRQTSNLQAVSICSDCICINIVGNVLGPVAGSDPKSAVEIDTYISSGFNNGMLNFGSTTSTPAAKTALVHGNYDNVNKKTMWDASIDDRALPASLYLTSKPAFFGSDPWPWVTPENGAAPLAGTLPARERVGINDVTKTLTAPTLSRFILNGNRPNPFFAGTEISFTLPGPHDHVSLKIYDLHGNEITTLVNDVRPAGTHVVSWSGIDGNGRSVGKGTYLCALKCGGYTVTKRMVLVR